MAQIEFTQTHGQRRKRTGAGCVDDTVRAAQIKLVGNAPGDDIAQKTWERGFSPRHIGIGDTVADGLCLIFRHAIGAQGVEPNRPLQPRAKMDDQLCRTRGAENHTDPAFVDVPEVSTGRIFQYLLGNDEAKQLARIGLLDHVGWHAVGQRIERDFVQKGTALAVCFIGCSRIGVVVVINQPVVGRNFFDLILAFHNATPETAHIGRARKQRTYTDHCNRWGGRFSVFSWVAHQKD